MLLFTYWGDRKVSSIVERIPTREQNKCWLDDEIKSPESNHSMNAIQLLPARRLAVKIGRTISSTVCLTCSNVTKAAPIEAKKYIYTY